MFVLAEDRQKSGGCLQVCTIFLRFMVCLISWSNFWLDRTFQASAQTLFYIRFIANSLKFSTSFLPVLTQHSYLYIVVEWYRHWAKCTNTKFLLFWRNVSQHQTSCMLLCIRSLFHAVHTWSGYLGLFYAHCTDQICVRYWACDKLEVSGRRVKWRNKKCYQIMPKWNLELIIFYQGIWNLF